MNWEIKKRNTTREHTLWQGRDAEGKAIYCVMGDRDGIAVEPNGCCYSYSIHAAVVDNFFDHDRIDLIR